MQENIYRSAPMSLVQLYISNELARDVVAAIGEAELVQFRDLNGDVQQFNRSFVKEIRAVDEVLRKLRRCRAMLEDNNMLGEANDLPQENSLDPQDVVDDTMATVSDFEHKVATLYASTTEMAEKRDILMDKRELLRACEQFYAGKTAGGISTASTVALGAALLNDRAPLLEPEADDFEIYDEEESIETFSSASALEMPVVAGTVERARYGALEKLAWRATRGNLVLQSYPIERTDGTLKNVFVAYSHSDAINQRVRRVAEALGCTLFDVPSTHAARSLEVEQINAQLTQVFALLDSSTKSLHAELSLLQTNLPGWTAMMLKEKLVYSTLNLLNYDQQRRCLIGEGWVPTDDIALLRSILARVTQAAGASMPTVVNVVHTKRQPPTFHRTNKVTAAFQAIVDVYGVASYQEVNPALPAVVTFPFMFAVMFGDVGHGIILSLGALTLVLRETAIGKMKRDEIFDMAYGGRYVLLFMGLFSIFTGFIYNDIFSKSMTLFASGWHWPEDAKQGESLTAAFSHPYPFGLDWKWHGASNNLLFTNSYKMKMSILLGFVHMSYSLYFSLANAEYFHSWVDIVGNFVPSVLFMQSIFGYLCLTIVYKWCVDWVALEKPAPGLLNMLINMFLSPGTIDAQLYPGQKVVQTLLVLVALVCVPWLLLFKPLYLRRQHLSGGQFTHLENAEITIDDEDMHIHDEDDAHSHFEFGEIMIHQVIHTIEFCLNCVSHTASYLRLWALSLAHNQLSSVLWDMTIQNAFGPTGPMGIFMVFVLFGAWFIGTVVILVCMEGTSAMLHSLRLHWVEAMSKHFEGEGTLFIPLSFKNVEL